MLGPSRFAKMGNTGHLSGAFGAVGRHVRKDSADPPGAVKRVEIVGHVGRDLPEDREITGDDRYAQHQRLDERQAVAFDERRKEERPCMVEQCVQALGLAPATG